MFLMNIIKLLFIVKMNRGIRVLYFSDDRYREVALKLSYNNMDVPSCEDALLILLKDFLYEDLDNLCNKMCDNYYLLFNQKISNRECYCLIQSENLSEDIKKLIYDSAISLINNGSYLGTRINNGFNMSAWINHCYYVGECCYNLANMIGIDADKARTYGMLHDIGRKKKHNFNHVMDGFEYLVSLGYTDCAIGCLTHSFVNGGRCSNNEKAIPGFFVDKDGNARFMDGYEKDDITLFLEQYKYNEYDLILNIADLMAIDRGIVSPYDRIQDIATRRELDPTNRGYFLAEISNLFVSFLNKIGYNDDSLYFIKADSSTSIDFIQEHFDMVSKYFYEVYKNNNVRNKRL